MKALAVVALVGVLSGCAKQQQQQQQPPLIPQSADAAPLASSKGALIKITTWDIGSVDAEDFPLDEATRRIGTKFARGSLSVEASYAQREAPPDSEKRLVLTLVEGRIVSPYLKQSSSASTCSRTVDLSDIKLLRDGLAKLRANAKEFAAQPSGKAVGYVVHTGEDLNAQISVSNSGNPQLYLDCADARAAFSGPLFDQVDGLLARGEATLAAAQP